MAPIKCKFIRANQPPLKNKELQQAIMIRSKLRNSKMFIKSRSLIDKNAYNKKRSVCVSLLRKTKKQYYSKLNVKNIVDNYKFWKKEYFV